MATSVTSAPAAPLPTTGVPQSSSQPAPAAPAGNAAVPTGYSSTPTDASFGGEITNAVTRLTAFAQQKMQDTQNEISSLFNSEGGPVDAAKLQVYSQRMSMYEMSMQMAKQIQEKEERATAVWTQP